MRCGADKRNGPTVVRTPTTSASSTSSQRWFEWSTASRPRPGAGGTTWRLALVHRVEARGVRRTFWPSPCDHRRIRRTLSGSRCWPASRFAFAAMVGKIEVRSYSPPRSRPSSATPSAPLDAMPRGERSTTSPGGRYARLRTSQGLAGHVRNGSPSCCPRVRSSSGTSQFAMSTTSSAEGQFNDRGKEVMQPGDRLSDRPEEVRAAVRVSHMLKNSYSLWRGAGLAAVCVA